VVHPAARLRRRGHDERQSLTPARARFAILLALTLAAAASVPGRVRAQSTQPGEVMVLPRGDVFQPLLADSKEPEIMGSVLKSWRALDRRLAAVELGESVGMLRWRGRRPGDGVQIGVSAAIFAQFDLETQSKDLLNTDFLIGMPVTVREGAWSARARFYHQSSHVGDTVLTARQPGRINLSFEAIELLVSRDLGPVRVYGGGEYLLRRDPGSLRRARAHVGAQVTSGPVLSAGGFGRARAVIAVDVKGPGPDRSAVGTSVRAGLEFTPPGAVPRRWGVLLHFYTGPAPYGQYYVEDITSLGLELTIAP